MTHETFLPPNGHEQHDQTRTDLPPQIDPIDPLHYRHDRLGGVLKNPRSTSEQKIKAQAERMELQGTIGALDEMLDTEDPLATADEQIALAEISDDFATQKEAAPYRRAKQYLEGHQRGENDHLSGDRIFQAWQEKRKKNKANVESKEFDEARKEAETESVKLVEDARAKIENVEKERVIDEVLQTGGFALHASLPEGLSQSGYGGFSDIKIRRSDSNAPFNGNEFELLDEGVSGYGGRESRLLSNKGIQEAVMFRPMTKSVYEDVEVKGKGLFAKNTIKRKHVGTEERRMSDVVEAGADEPAVEIFYKTFQNPDLANEETKHWSHDGRDGNVTVVSIVVPRQLADKLKAQAHEDPAVIRKLVDKIAVEKAEIPEKTWTRGSDATRGKPLRAPHAAWQRHHSGKSKMYFKDPGDRKFDESKVVEFVGT